MCGHSEYDHGVHNYSIWPVRGLYFKLLLWLPVSPESARRKLLLYSRQSLQAGKPKSNYSPPSSIHAHNTVSVQIDPKTMSILWEAMVAERKQRKAKQCPNMHLKPHICCCCCGPWIDGAATNDHRCTTNKFSEFGNIEFLVATQVNRHHGQGIAYLSSIILSE